MKVAGARGEQSAVRRIRQAVYVGGESRQDAVGRGIRQIVGVNAVRVGAAGDESPANRSGGRGGRFVGRSGVDDARRQTTSYVGQGDGDGRIVLESIPNANLAVAAARDELTGIFGHGGVQHQISVTV